ncbi:MAG: hypothetical protein ACOCXH_11205 [Cyclobacteriaceae bacterium]
MNLIYRTPHFSVLQDFINSLENRKFKFYASDIFDESLSEEEMHLAVQRAMQVCSSLNIAIANHFKTVYKAFDEEIGIDWKMSALGAYLVLMNGDTKLKQVANFQLDIIRNFLQTNAWSNN